MCECAQLDCDEMLTIPADAYREVRARSNRFVVVPGHVVDDIEHDVERQAAYWVIEKQGAGGDEAARLDD